MLAELRLEDTEVNVFELMSKDSLQMTEADRGRILEAVRATGACEDGGDRRHRRPPRHGHPGRHRRAPPRSLDGPRVPVVLTGAMRPFEMKQSDALQNLTEAIFATGVLPPGVYCVAHGRALPFPGRAQGPRAGHVRQGLKESSVRAALGDVDTSSARSPRGPGWQPARYLLGKPRVEMSITNP